MRYESCTRKVCLLIKSINVLELIYLLDYSVHHLKEYVQRICNIPLDKQVLLVSGGESLDPESRVCSYSAGTDTNPIFLFSKSVIESTTPPSTNVEYGSDAGMWILEFGYIFFKIRRNTLICKLILA